MADYEYDIGVIGGGAAGLTVAAGAAQLGVKVLLVEKEPNLGGDCLHYGCVPSKTLIKSAAVYHSMRTAGSYGLPEVDLPPVDFGRIADRIQSVIDTIQVHDSVERFCGLGVKVLFGDASFVDDHEVDVSGERISARFWVIATGSDPALPPLDGLNEIGCWTNRDIFRLRELPRRLLVLGGGPIGCEMAQAFARLGAEVHVVQRNTQILKREDADMAKVVQDSMEAEGVSFYLGSAVKQVRRTETGVELDFILNGRDERLTADQLLVAAGRSPAVASLRLENAGVECDRRGVKVDGRLRTSRKHIFAAGDVLGQYQFTHAAGYEAGIVISNTVFRLPRKVDYRLLPWCTYTDPELASVGMNEKRAAEAGEEYSVWTEPFADNDRAQAEGNVAGKIKLILDKKEKPLGVQIVGSHAGDVAAQWVAALNAGVGMSKMASAVLPYPTIAEINKRVAGQVLSKKLFSDKVRKTLGFLFDYKGRACTLD